MKIELENDKPKVISDPFTICAISIVLPLPAADYLGGCGVALFVNGKKHLEGPVSSLPEIGRMLPKRLRLACMLQPTDEVRMVLTDYARLRTLPVPPELENFRLVLLDAQELP